MGGMKEESEKPKYEVQGKPIETVADVFKFIFEQEEAKAKIADTKKRLMGQRADVIKASFQAIAGEKGSVAAAKFAYQRWLMNEEERKTYDGTLFQATKDLGDEHDMMESNRVIVMEQLAAGIQEADDMMERILTLGAGNQDDDEKPEGDGA